jgi:hypothetical protein
MARIINGINGEFSGKVGTVVGATWKGIPYMRSRPSKRTIPPSPLEIANRYKFGFTQAWLRPLLAFVREGFKGYSPTVEGFIAAKSYLHKHAIEGEGPQLTINPAKVKLSHGSLPLPAKITCRQKGKRDLEFTWDVSNIADSSSKDQAMILAYDVEKANAVFRTTGQFRSTGKDILPELPAGTYHVYAAFVAADRSRQSDSIYLGPISI